MIRRGEMTTKHHARGTKEYTAEGEFTFNAWVKDSSVLRTRLERMAKECELKATDFTWHIQPAKFARVEVLVVEVETPAIVKVKRKAKKTRKQSKTRRGKKRKTE